MRPGIPWCLPCPMTEIHGGRIMNIRDMRKTVFPILLHGTGAQLREPACPGMTRWGWLCMDRIIVQAAWYIRRRGRFTGWSGRKQRSLVCSIQTVGGRHFGERWSPEILFRLIYVSAEEGKPQNRCSAMHGSRIT